MGIRGTLLVAFALIWGFVLFASAVAIQALSEVTEIVSGVTQQRASTIVESSRLAQQAGRAITVAITAARPISALTDEALFRRQIDEIRQAEDELLAARQALLLGQSPDRNALLAPVGEMLDNIHALIDATGERLKMRASVAVAVAAATKTDLSFQRAAGPTERAFGSDLGGMNANGRGSEYRQELTALYRFDQVQRTFAAVYRTLLGASQSPSVVELNLQAIVLRREVADLRQAAANLSGDGTAEIGRTALHLAELAETADGVVPQRRQELQLLDRSTALLDRNDVISKDLLEKVDLLIAEQNNALVAGTYHAARVARSGTVRMIAVTVISLVCSALIVWLYVFRNLAVRLDRIKSAMLRLATGDLTVALPKESADEVGRMAGTLHVFQATAAAADRREQALKQAKEEAEAALAQLTEAQESLLRAEKLASLGQLVAGIAHEINTPVGNALAASSQSRDETARLESLMASGKLRRSELEDYLGTIKELSDILMRNCQRAGQLIRDFRQVAADQTSEQRRRFDLASQLRETLHTLRHRFDRAQISLVTDLADIVMDSVPGALSQIIINLAENALAHAFSAGAGGSLTVSASQIAQDRVEITVADDGKGIIQEVLPKIFDPFFTTNRGAGNTGLGLHIVHNLVTGPLGGTIHVASTVGSGTQFVLRLPLASPALATSVSHHETPPLLDPLTR
jgi:two-component system, NtrC family, sensor kinase